MRHVLVALGALVGFALGFIVTFLVGINVTASPEWRSADEDANPS